MVKYKNLKFLGFPNYKVGTDGSVWSRYKKGPGGRVGDKWRRRKFGSNQRGYQIVDLGHKGKMKAYQVHRLVLMAFVGPCPEGKEARHFPDRTVTNCRLENLSWATKRRNQRDRRIHGTDPSGERNGRAKLTWKKVHKIRRLYKTISKDGKMWSQDKLAMRFGIHQTVVSDIVNFRYWIREP